MDENGFAFKSGKLQFNDRILACNGVDFTKEHTTQQVKDIFYEMAQEPLLRMAISRGVSLLDTEANDSRDEEGHMTTQEGVAQEGIEVGRERGVGTSSVSMATPAGSSVGGADVVGEAKDGGRRGESAPEPPGSPRICKRERE